MNLYKQLDYYCERIDGSYWSEPINAISNIGFILVGLYFLTRKEPKTLWTKYLSILSIIVGTGSYLFHTHANTITLIADVFPITVFIGSFIFFTFKKVIPIKLIFNIIITAFFVIIGVILNSISVPYFNGSHSYAHAILLLIMMTIILKKRNSISAKYFSRSTIIFIISLIFRTFDNQICGVLPIGTHFLWHTMNAILLWHLILKSTQYKE